MNTDNMHILNVTSSDWEKQRGCQLFIAGGTGFIGRWILESFVYANRALGLNANAVVLSRNPRIFLEKAPQFSAAPELTFIQGDVRNFKWPAGNFTHVIHAATDASSTINVERSLYMFDTILEGARHMLDFAVAKKAHRFLFTSSGAVYGQQPHDLPFIAEDYLGAPRPSDPGAAYGEGKRAAELLCHIYANDHGLGTTIARCFAFVGEHLPLDGTYAIGNFMQDVLHRRPIQVKGDGTAVRTYLYAADMVSWLWTILFRGVAGRVYNVGSDKALSIRDLAEQIRLIADDPLVSVSIPDPTSATMPSSRYVPSIQRARKELNLHAHIGLEEAIIRTMQVLRSKS